MPHSLIGIRVGITGGRAWHFNKRRVEFLYQDNSVVLAYPLIICVYYLLVNAKTCKKGDLI